MHFFLKKSFSSFLLLFFSFCWLHATLKAQKDVLPKLKDSLLRKERFIRRQGGMVDGWLTEKDKGGERGGGGKLPVKEGEKEEGRWGKK